MKFNPKLIILEYYWIIIDQYENRPRAGIIGKTANSGCYAVNQIVVPVFFYSVDLFNYEINSKIEGDAC